MTGGENMKNHWTAKVENPFTVGYGKSAALRQIVGNVPELWEEFRKTLTHREDYDEFDDKFREFIRNQNFRIIIEKPVVRVKDERYVVDVYYVVEW